MTLEEAKDMKTALESYKASIEASIAAASKAQSDAANAEIAKMKAQYEEVKTGLKALEESAKHPFGLPGLKEDLKSGKVSFNMGNFYRAQFVELCHRKDYAQDVLPSVSKPWDVLAPQEKEICQEYAKRRGSEFGNAQSNAKGFSMGPNGVQKDMSDDTGAAGGFLVPPEVYQGEIIEPVYAMTPILNMPCMKLTGLRGDIPIPVDSQHLTAYWVGETTKPTKSDGKWTLEWLRPKKAGVFSKVSNRLLAFSNYDIGAEINKKMTRDMSVLLSAALTNGLGSDYQPRGLLADIAKMTASTALGTNGARFSVTDLLYLKMALAGVNELRDTPTYGALMHPNAYFGMLTERVPTATSGMSTKNGMPLQVGTFGLLDPDVIQKASKFQIGHTTQIAGTNTKGTSTTCSTVVAGDFSKFCWATFRDPIFRVSDVAGDGSTGSAFLDDQIYLVMFLECDARLLRAAAFAYVNDAETKPANW
jgi:HK97 family phage major capsid protein